MAIMISVAGAVGGCGCTHLSLSIATGLKRKFHRARIAVIERSDNNALTVLGEELELIDDNTAGDFYSYKGIDYYIKQYELAAYKDYDYIVIDAGCSLSDDYYRADYAMLVVPSRKWNRGYKAVYETCEKIDKRIGLSNVIIVSPFADSEAQREIKKVFSKNTVLFTGYEENPLDKTVFDVENIIGKQKKSKFFGFKKNNDEDEEDFEEEVQTPVVSVITEKEEAEDVQPKAQDDATYSLSDNTEKKEETNTVENRVDEKTVSSAGNDSNNVMLEMMNNLIKLQMMNNKNVPSDAPQDVDELTGLCSRKSFKKEIAETEESGIGYAVIFFDVNNLKKTNDGLGHDKGDILLTTIASEIKKRFPKLYRVGGDEFNAISPLYAFSVDKLKELDDTLRDITLQRNDGIIYEVAYGYALSTETYTVSEAMSIADKRMYEDKKRKKAAYEQTVEKEPVAASQEVIEKKEESSEPMFPIDSVIAGTLPFGNDEPNRKMLDTMWFTDIRLAYEHNGYKESKFRVFATEYLKPPLPINNIAVVEDGDTYAFAYGKNNIVRTGNSVFMVNARFTTEGKLSVSIIPQNDEINIVNRTDKENIGRYTPRNFGLKVKDMQIYPIRPNIDGLCDSIILKDNDVFVTTGNVDSYGIVLQPDNVSVIPINER